MTKKVLVLTMITCASMISASSYESPSNSSQKSPTNAALGEVRSDTHPLDHQSMDQFLNLQEEIEILNDQIQQMSEELIIIKNDNLTNTTNLRALVNELRERFAPENTANPVIKLADQLNEIEKKLTQYALDSDLRAMKKEIDEVRRSNPLTPEQVAELTNNVATLQNLARLTNFANLQELLKTCLNTLTKNHEDSAHIAEKSGLITRLVRLENNYNRILEEKTSLTAEEKAFLQELVAAKKLSDAQRNKIKAVAFITKFLQIVTVAGTTYAAFNTKPGNDARKSICALFCGLLPGKTSVVSARPESTATHS